MKVTMFDFYDEDRETPIDMKLKDKTVSKGATFKKNDVTYMVTKVFNKKGYKRKCVEVKMVAYKLPNTVGKFAHKCPAKKEIMLNMEQKHVKELIKKYGKATIKAWKKGTVKMAGTAASVCPDCKCVFWKDKNELPDTIEVVSLKGKKRLIKRK